jgi:hypothetical protein
LFAGFEQIFRGSKLFTARTTTMADIISLNTKLQLSQDKRDALIRKRKILAVQKVFQCTHCAQKCEKCGVHTELTSESRIDHNHSIGCPYRFCDSCREEYIDFILRLKGGGDPACYWHNDAWFESWRRWLDYQAAMDRYVKTPEFFQLIQELKQNRIDE